jgi:hypothetical protein
MHPVYLVCRLAFLTKCDLKPLTGGQGGAGGHGGKKGGHGGTGNAPRIGIENLSRFTVISGELFLVMLAHCLILPGGGVGGAGGTSGVQDQSAQGRVGTAEEPEVVTTGPGPIVQGIVPSSFGDVSVTSKSQAEKEKPVDEVSS